MSAAAASRPSPTRRAAPQPLSRQRHRRPDAIRKARGRKAADVAADAIAWGEPVLGSAITTVADGRLYYRGRDAVRLAETETLEAVARLLRGGDGVAVASSAAPGAARRAFHAGAGIRRPGRAGRPKRRRRES